MTLQLQDYTKQVIYIITKECGLHQLCVMFLEPIGDQKFNCGIYGSVWRNFSNCKSFPLNRNDIERYKCPSYFVTGEAPIQFVVQPSVRVD